ncbi:hypothetical protein [Deefgea rivuli]|uniref:hypothetical protein n=1 Tax=Deefgea rivuli TaxID=400948 RepID=UPI00048610FD|nr:hypothetical protein [Deefgea rivuli]
MNPIREQKKQQLVFRSQLHRLQLETKLLESRRPLSIASSFMGGMASWGFFTRMAEGLGGVHPALGRLARGAKFVSVLVAVARLLRNK